MKKLALIFCFPFVFLSCAQKFTSSDYTSTKFHYKKIAIVPFQIHTSVKNLPEGVTLAMLEKSESQKGKIMQRDLYRYLLRELAKSSRKVQLQDVNKTNKIFKGLGMNRSTIFTTSKTELAKMLEVDAIIYGNVYQHKPRMRLKGDDLMNMSGANNKISTVLYVYEKARGRIEWKYDRSQSGFPSDYAPDVVKGLLRKAARNFPM